MGYFWDILQHIENFLQNRKYCLQNFTKMLLEKFCSNFGQHDFLIVKNACNYWIFVLKKIEIQSLFNLKLKY